METNSLTQRNTLTNWSHRVEKRRGKKNTHTHTQENSLIIVTDRRTLRSTIPSACLYSYGAVQRFTSHSLPFFFSSFSRRQWKASRRPLTRHSRECGTSSESQRNRAGGRSFVLWLGAAPARWLTLLAGWPANCLADWWRSRNMIQTQQQSCLLQEIVLTFWEETHSFSLQSRVRWEDRYQSHDNMKLQPAAN